MILLRKVSFWLGLAGLGGAAALVYSQRAEFDRPSPPPPVAPALKPTGRNTIGAAAIVEALHENTSVGVPVSGLVTTIHVKVWDRVEAGAPLLQLDDRELLAQLIANKADIAVTEAQVKRLQTQLARIEKLAAAGVTPDADRDTLRDDLAVSIARLESARATATRTRLLLERLVVRAPVAGTILQVNVRAGEFTVAGSAKPPLVLGDISQVQVRADVDEQLAPRVKKGLAATGYVKGDSQHPIAMEFVRIEPYIIPKVSLTGASTERVDTRVLQVIYRFVNPPERPVYVGQQIDLFISE